MDELLQQKLAFLQGIGPAKAALLENELRITTFGHLLTYYPFRHEDRSKITPISQANEDN
jgi:ATP-dependent DNA helicase RecG